MLRLWNRGYRDYSTRLRVFLDLDDCLVNSEPITAGNYEQLQAILFKHGIDSTSITFDSRDRSPISYCVAFRPGLFQFLDEASKLSDLYVFSAGSDEYVEKIVKKIDPNGKYFQKYWGAKMVSWNFFAKNEFEFHYTKDLKRLEGHFHPQRSLLIDNYITNMIYHPHNGIVTETSQIMQKGGYYLLHCERMNKNPYFMDDGEPLKEEINPLTSILEDLKHLEDHEDIRPYLSQKYQIVRQLKTISKATMPKNWYDLVQSYEDHPQK